LLELAASLLGNTVVATAFAFDRLAVALDPTRFFHGVQERVQRAWAHLMTGRREILTELNT